MMNEDYQRMITQLGYKIWLLEKGAELSGNKDFYRIADSIKNELAEKTAKGAG